MRWTENETQFVPKKYAQCDFCDHDAKKEHRSVKQCHFCKKDICWKCGIHFDIFSNLISPSFSGDYPDYCCEKCWELGKEYRERITAIRDKAEEDEEKLIVEWKIKSKRED